MALRDYKCLDCGHIVESLIRSELDVPTHCPECKGTQMEQQVSNYSRYTGNFGPCSTPKKRQR